MCASSGSSSEPPELAEEQQSSKNAQDVLSGLSKSIECRDNRFFLKIRGLPWKSSSSDIVELFCKAGIQVLGGIDGILLLSRKGRPSGHAFVELASKEDHEKALKLDWMQHTLSGRYIEAFPADAEHLRNYVMSRKLRQNRSGSSTEVVYVRGLSWETSDADVREFFSQYKTTDIVVPKSTSGDALGYSYVRFASPDEARKALSLNNSVLGSRTIEVYPLSEELLDEALNADLLNLASYGRSKPSREPLHMQKKVDTRAAPDTNSLTYLSKKDLEKMLISKGHRVIANGLPFSDEGIKNFFWPARPTRILYVRSKSGKLNGSVVVEFACHEDAVKAMEKNGTSIASHFVGLKLFSSSPSEEGDRVVRNA